VIQFLPADTIDFLEVAGDLSLANRRECEAMGLDPGVAVANTFHASEITYAIRIDGATVGLYGLCPTPHYDTGCPWMVGTEEMPIAGLALLRHARGITQEFLTRYPRLENYVDARNQRLLRALMWVGFDIDPPIPVGPDYLPFHRYHLEAE
jgi:hypothetical protein